MNFLYNLEAKPADPILGLTQSFIADTNKNKVNLGVGIYKSEDLKNVLCETVKKAEIDLANRELSRGYLPISGDQEYLDLALKLIFNSDIDDRIFAAQTPGGTGALRVIGDLLAQEDVEILYMPNPTWANHRPIFQQAGVKTGSYEYYDSSSNAFSLESMLSSIKEMKSGQAILLHACCHNPTGADPSIEEWKQISALIKEKNIFPIFDFAYHGLGSGLEEDSKSVRLFLEDGHEFCLAYSFSKNFNLYAERIGLMAVVTKDKSFAKKVGSNVKVLVRRNYSNPPIHGAHIIKTILNSEELKAEWKEELNGMRERIANMRNSLASKLIERDTKVDFSFISRQKGLFSICGLSKDHVEKLKKEQGIYMPSSGRINVAGLNTKNIDYVADAIAAVL